MTYNIKTGKEKCQGYAHNNSSVRLINTTYFMNLKKLTSARDHLKTSNLSRMTSKKILDLDGWAPEPAIQLGDAGQRIPCFDSC